MCNSCCARPNGSTVKYIMMFDVLVGCLGWKVSMSNRDVLWWVAIDSLFASCSFLAPSLNKFRWTTWELQFRTVMLKLQFIVHINLFTNTFQKNTPTFYYKYLNFNCLWYSLKHHHQPNKVKWCSMFTCKNGDSWYAPEFKILHFPKLVSMFKRNSEARSLCRYQ